MKGLAFVIAVSLAFVAWVALEEVAHYHDNPEDENHLVVEDVGAFRCVRYEVWIRPRGGIWCERRR